MHFVPTGPKRHDDHGATKAVTCGSTHTASLSMRGPAADAHEDYAIFDVHIQPSTSDVALGELTVKYTCSEGATARITVHDEFPLGFTKFGASSSIGAIATATVRQCQDGVTPAVLELKAKNGDLHTSESNAPIGAPIDMYTKDTYVLVEMLLPESDTASSSPSATVELTVECEDAEPDSWGDDFQVRRPSSWCPPWRPPAHRHTTPPLTLVPPSGTAAASARAVGRRCRPCQSTRRRRASGSARSTWGKA